jgi:transposase
MKQWLPEDDLVYFIMDVVRGLDLRSIYQEYDATKGGQPPYDPRMMVGLLLYAYCVGIFSSRKIEKATYHSVPLPISILTMTPSPSSASATSRPFRGCLCRCCGYARRWEW